MPFAFRYWQNPSLVDQHAAGVDYSVGHVPAYQAVDLSPGRVVCGTPLGFRWGLLANPGWRPRDGVAGLTLGYGV